MAFFSAKFRRDFRRSIELYISAFLVLVAAIVFSYAEDWCRAHGRPEWMIYGSQGITIFLFISDGIVVCVTSAKLLMSAVRDLLQ
jgi:hypothetical protein